MTIAFIEDDVFYRQLLTSIATRTGRFRIVGTFSSTREALVSLPERGADIVVIDIHLVGHSGIAAIGQIHERWPEARCVMLTASDADSDVFAALEAGAVGYILKSDSHEQIVAALDEAGAGGAPMSRSVARQVVRSFVKPPMRNGAGEPLTRREREILAGLATGHTYKEIAQKLSISAATVKNHLSRIYEKLGVRSRTEAVVKWLGR
jgi:DNA-binding NarL/FixJ family response regulator